MITSNAVPFIVQGDNIILVVDNQTHNISKDTHPKFALILDALKKMDWDVVRDNLDLTKAIKEYSNGNIDIKAGILYWKGTALHNMIATRIMEMMQQDFSVEPLIKFLDNLMDNTSYRAVSSLYDFLEKNAHPITEDGCFLAYKRVKWNAEKTGLLDCYTGKMDNSVGAVVEMPRNMVNDDPNQTCSAGLHFCALGYLGSSGYGGGGNPIVILKINPRDVVAIPSDYNDQKGRACRYEVVGMHGVELDRNEEFDKAVSSY
jgi:hypothetical protein